MSRPGTKTLGAVMVIAALSLGVGVYVGGKLTSPADAAARAAPPEASEVTVEVEKRVLRNEVVGRGEASYAGAVEVKLEPAGAERPVVTGQVPNVGKEINEGTVLLEVVGRPVIALQGALPMYRSLAPGMSGPDVDQLKDTLRRLGFYPGVDDEYSDATGEAVELLYQRVGYEPPKPARRGEATPLPSAEVVYLPSLPRRVDDVKVRLGGEVAGAVMSVSGAKLVVKVPVDAAAGKLLRKGMKAAITLPSGAPVTGEVTRIKGAGGDEYQVTIKPRELTAKQTAELRSANVRVTIPVKSSKGKVLAVPLTALSAGPDGESRVEVSRNGRLSRVTVRVGLTASGYAEVSPVSGDLGEGDLVVVGGRE